MARLTLYFKEKPIGQIALGREPVSIGRSPDCNIVIDSLAVNPVHARIHANGTVHSLEDLGSRTGTRVNSVRITRHELRHGDCIEVGKHILIYHEKRLLSGTSVIDAEPSGTARSSAAEIGFLQIVRGPRRNQTITLDQPLTTIGRPHQQMALVAHRNNGYFLTHLEGQSSPTVDNVEIGENTWPLIDGNLIEMGEMALRFKVKRRSPRKSPAVGAEERRRKDSR
jgi:predicted component of type VI protein secretion system